MFRSDSKSPWGFNSGLPSHSSSNSDMWSPNFGILGFQETVLGYGFNQNLKIGFSGLAQQLCLETICFPDKYENRKIETCQMCKVVRTARENAFLRI